MRARLIAVCETILILALILAQLWFVGKAVTFFTLIPATAIIISWVARKETLHSLGLLRAGFSGSGWLWKFAGGAIALILVIGAFVQGPIFSDLHAAGGLILRFLSYIVPAFLQQVVFNLYFVNRIDSFAGGSRRTVAVSAFTFAFVHLPNPVLTVLTLFGGWLSSSFYLRQRSVYPLALAHAALAAVTYCALPHAWHHGFRVGMQYYLYAPSPLDSCAP